VYARPAGSAQGQRDAVVRSLTAHLDVFEALLERLIDVEPVSSQVVRGTGQAVWTHSARQLGAASARVNARGNASHDARITRLA
jgi:membrane-anchored protein YejM (alkaline phosphatase superfamily)